MAAMTFRNRLGELVDIPQVAATRFKNEFGSIFEQAATQGAVAITKHDSPKAVLLSFPEFQALVKASSPALNDLDDEFDGLLARMQSAKARKGMHEAFNASPAELGRAAVSSSRKPQLKVAAKVKTKAR